MSTETDTQPPEYEIKAVGDFLKVPQERWDACLLEFRQFLGLAKSMKNFADELAKVTGADPDKNTVEAFTWIDDDDKNVTIRIREADQTSA